MTDWGPIGEEVFRRTYSRPLGGRSEQWHETVHRVVKGNTALVSPDHIMKSERRYLEENIEAMNIMPAGRHLWVSGVAGRQFLFNCHRAGWTSRLADHFCFAFDELMKGGGVGANYSQEYLDLSGRLGEPPEMSIVCDPAHPDYAGHLYDNDHIEVTARYVEDSRQGWVDALRWLIDATQYNQRGRIAFDVSNIRGKGERINGFGGIASGPEALVKMLRETHDALYRARFQPLDPLSAMDIDHAIASCVISGNVRRSARMSILHWTDDAIFDFLACKDDKTKHWTTNISVEVDDNFYLALAADDDWAKDVLRTISERAYEHGEPGIFNSSKAAVGETGDVRCTNPCGEIALEEWENCNLGHLNLANLTDDRELFVAARMMTRFLMRATFGTIEDPRQQEVVARNRRIGVGLYGFQEWLINRFGLDYQAGGFATAPQTILASLYGTIEAEARLYAAELDIPMPIKLTTVAPTGSTAKLSGNSEGIHPIYAKHFIRRVRYAENDVNVPRNVPVEDDLYSDNTVVASFYCEDHIFRNVAEENHHLVMDATEISMENMLHVQQMIQRVWSDNAVSFTVNFNPNDVTPSRIAAAITEFDVKGFTVMPDGAREQAPYQRITEYEWREAEGGTGQALDDCATGACPVR